jgi:hypothetical protein
VGWLEGVMAGFPRVCFPGAGGGGLVARAGTWPRPRRPRQSRGLLSCGPRPQERSVRACAARRRGTRAAG